jgi:small-conductance mechanosensitive channel
MTTSSIHSLQEAHSQTQTEQTVQPPKTLQAQAETQNPAAKDTVTINEEARQALTHSTTQDGGGGQNDRG